MDADQTTRSVTIDLQASHLTTEGKHLINTTKVLRGHKLKTQDFIKLQLMRFRYCSPVKYEEQIQQNLMDISKSTEFSEKYRWFEYVNDEKELHKMIAYQREKESRQTAKRIKLINPHQNMSATKYDKHSFYNTQFSIKPKPATSQERRTASNWRKMNKTISFNSTEPAPHNKSKIHFTSKNLGNKMNDYMNQMIDPTLLTENPPHQVDPMQYTMPFREANMVRFEKALRKDKQPNSYLKQMKKRFRSKYSAIIQTSKQINQQYTHGNMEPFDEKAENSMNTIMHISQQPIFHSMQFKSVQNDSPEFKGKLYQPPKTAGKIQQYNDMTTSVKISK